MIEINEDVSMNNWTLSPSISRLENNDTTTLEILHPLDTEVDFERDENLAKVEIAILGIIFVVTILGNSIVLFALWIRRKYAGRKKLSRMYFFILHLSIADLITAFFSVLPQLIWDITFRFQGGNFLCKVVKFGQTLGPYLSSYILMATAIDRHQAICYPLTYCSWTSRRSKIMVYIAWACSLIFCIPQIIIFSYQQMAENVYDCWATFPEYWGEKTYVLWYCVSIFIVPLLVLVFTYTRICREIWNSSESTLRPRNSQKIGPGKRIPLISRAKINTVKQTISVIVLYILCSTPFIVAQLWGTMNPNNPFLDGPAYTILLLLYSLNSCVNPWIYLTFNRELRRLLLMHYTAFSRYYRSTDGGHSPSNSSGEIQSTSLKSLSRWPRHNGTRRPNQYTHKIIRRPPGGPLAAENHRCLVTTAT